MVVVVVKARPEHACLFASSGDVVATTREVLYPN